VVRLLNVKMWEILRKLLELLLPRTAKLVKMLKERMVNF